MIKGLLFVFLVNFEILHNPNRISNTINHHDHPKDLLALQPWDQKLSKVQNLLKPIEWTGL